MLHTTSWADRMVRDWTKDIIHRSLSYGEGKGLSGSDSRSSRRPHKYYCSCSLSAIDGVELIDPSTLAKVFVSPLVRAQETLALLNLPSDVPVETTSLLTEFNYGDFEGMKTSQIKSITGNPKWETWTDAAPNAETPAQVQKRIDTMISKIKGEYHAPALADSSVRRRNILLVARISFCLQQASLTVHRWSYPTGCRSSLAQSSHHSCPFTTA